MTMRALLLVVAPSILGLGSIPAQRQAAEPNSGAWPDYRGPTSDGHAPGAAVPLRWSETKNVTWKTPIRGEGWSSPVVMDGKVWLTSATPNGKRMFVVAVDLESGKALVERTLFENDEPEPKNRLNSYASPSPVIETGRVYVHFGTYGTACLDTAGGETLWERRDIHCDHMEGPGSSPVLWKDLLIFHMDGGDVQYVIALDKETGKTRWKTPRSENLDDKPPDLRKAYSTPVFVEVDGKPWMISSGAEATVAYDPARGQELWKVRHGGFSMSARPLVMDDLLFLNTGFMKPQLVAFRTGGRGDVTENNLVWHYRRNVPAMASCVLVGERIYMVGDGGILTCLDAKTGAPVWRKRIGGQHCASPVYAAGRIYFFDREGTTVVIQPGEKYRELARNRLDAGFMASAAVAGDAFVLRTKTHLYRIEGD